MLAYGTSNDSYHLAAPEPGAIGVAEMMRAAIERAGVELEQVGYINAHGTSTPLGDAAETKAIKDVFGDHAYDLAVSSTKSMMGLPASARPARSRRRWPALAVHHGRLPPTINYEHPDPVCDWTTSRMRRGTPTSRSRCRLWGSEACNACVLIGRVE